MKKGEIMPLEQKLKISLSKKDKMLGLDNPSWKGGLVTLNCLECNIEIKKYPSQIFDKNFCSRKCNSIYKKNDPNHASWNIGIIRSEETKQKNRLSHLGKMTGENHFAWIKDRTKLKRYEGSEEKRSPIYKDWRKRVITRDNWKCKIENNNCNGRLEVHHILSFTEYPELRYEINNGITLCHFHHPRKRVEEINLSPYFKSLVTELK